MSGTRTNENAEYVPSHYTLSLNLIYCGNASHILIGDTRDWRGFL
jgi:hypothetical protein